MDFYTNVVRYGNNLLIREVKNGQRVNSKLKYKPTMFVPVMKQTIENSLDGKYVTPIEHESIKECSEWLKITKVNHTTFMVMLNTHILTYLHNILIV